MYIYQIEAEHKEHAKHELEANGGELPPRIVYPYMNKRDKVRPALPLASWISSEACWLMGIM